jgi:predicted  nucleic acid-binding Zn-ribbon protein
MAFPNAREQKKAFTDEELEAEKTQLLNEISALGIKVSEATEDHAKISQAIIDKKSELEKIEAAIASHAPTLEQHQNELEQIQAQIPDAQKLLEQGKELDLDIMTKRQQHESLLKDIDHLNTLESNKIADIDVAKGTHENICKKISEAETEFSLIKAAHDKAVAELVEQENSLKLFIGDLEKKVSLLSLEAAGNTSISIQHQDLLSSLKGQIDNAKSKLDGINAEIEQTKSNEVLDAQKRSAALDAREKTIETREGDASLKDSWLREKKKSLIAIKTELELHLGRKIPVNIPPDENGIQ